MRTSQDSSRNDPAAIACPAARREHGRGERQDPLGELRAAGEHLARLLTVAAREHAEVEAGREHALAPGEDDHRAVVLRPVERRVERAEHRHREGVDLAVVHRDRRDGSVQLIGHQLVHRRLPGRGRRAA
jgi:hypothetical protein